MTKLHSKYRKGFDNLTVDSEDIVKITIGDPNPSNPRVWMIYFLGKSDNGKEKVIRTWFFESKEKRGAELNRIREKYPTIQI